MKKATILLVVSIAAIAISAVSCSRQSKQANNDEKVKNETVADAIKAELTRQGYDYEFFEYDGYFRTKFGEAGANLDVNPDHTISFFLYNRVDAVNDQDMLFTSKVVETLEALGYKNQGAGPENCDNYFTRDDTVVIAPEMIERALAESGVETNYCKLIGGGSLSITKKNGKPQQNGKSNIAVTGDDEDVSFFSDQLDKQFDTDIVALIESLGYKDTGRGEDGSTHFFKKQTEMR